MGLLKTKEISLLFFFVLVCILFFALSVFFVCWVVVWFWVLGVAIFSNDKSESIFKKMTVLISMEDKTCKTCERTMDINNFSE